MKRPTKEVFRGAYDEIHYERYAEHLNKYIDHRKSKNKELIENNKDQIIEAFRAGRKAGAIFKTQRDSEGLAERYLRDLTITQSNKK